MKTKVTRMTEGNILKILIRFSIPILMGNLFQQLYNIADSVIVGKYVGTNGLAAVGAVSAIQFFFLSFCIGMSGGIGIVIAQFFGAQDDNHVKKSIINGAVLALAIATLMSLVGFLFAEPCLKLMGTPDEILGDSILYMKSVCIGIIGIALYNTLAEMIRALGDSKTPLKFLIFASVTNIILDLVLIINFDLGVLGAGIATATSQFLAGICLGIYAIKKNPYFAIKREELQIDRWIIMKCVKTGIPVGVQFSMIAVSCIALQIIINGYGAVIVAVYTVTSKVETVMVQPFQTLTTALQAYSGQNIGAGEEGRVKAGFKCGSLIMAVYTMCVTPIIFFGGAVIVSGFVSDPEVIELGASALKITSCFYIFLGLIYVTRGTLNGLGDTAFAFMNGVMEMLGRICLAKPITSIGAVGAWGIWIATGLTWMATGLLGLGRFMQGKWKIKGK
ncbi:MAG: MATE family efflux transporter [Eubacteriales bacterium]